MGDKASQLRLKCFHRGNKTNEINLQKQENKCLLEMFCKRRIFYLHLALLWLINIYSFDSAFKLICILTSFNDNDSKLMCAGYWKALQISPHLYIILLFTWWCTCHKVTGPRLGNKWATFVSLIESRGVSNIHRGAAHSFWGSYKMETHPTHRAH